MTRRLYYENPYLRAFSGTVLWCRPGKAGFEAALDRTAFYPEGGGQPADTGLLGGVRVLDVRERDGEVVHILDAPVDAGSLLEGEVDWQRRFDYMQQHSGEHIVSGLIHSRFGYHNVGFHMGATETTVDFDGPLTAEQAREIEAAANEIVWENRTVNAFVPDREELSGIAYRSKKELEGPVRIVEIPGADVCACCGTHVSRTGEIGCIKVTSLIHYKGGTRMTMACGRRALADYQGKQEQALQISNLLSAKTEEIAQAVKKMKEESGARAFQIVGLYRELFSAWAQAYPESDRRLLVFRDGLAPQQLREFCGCLCKEKKGSVVLACSEKDGLIQYAMAGRKDDMRPLAKELNARLNGRGGGSAAMVQGTWNAGREAVSAAFLEGSDESGQRDDQ